MNDIRTKLSIRNLSLWFGDKHVLKGVSTLVPERRVTALIGPSGCGKSTLLRACNRMHDLTPDARIKGSLMLESQDIYDRNIPVTQVRSRIGMVFQKANPFPKSIYDNICYGLRINGVHRTQWPDITEQALKESFLWDEVKDDLKKPATRLSGGQQQRLCIARAVALRPEVILMDEPCSALDPVSTLKIEELIVKLKEQYTIVIVTHNMQQAQRVADKTVFLYLGEVIEEGVTTELFNNPVQQLTGNYIRGRFG